MYPEFTFVWDNYLYSCGGCNLRKIDKFAVFHETSGILTHVNRKRNDPVVPPQAGASVLIDPRKEDPFSFMELDLIDTFFFVPISPPESLAYQRTEFTIDTLGLNSRDYLVAAREEAYNSYKARLFEYAQKENNGATLKQLQTLINALQRMGHTTVWREMQRQHLLIPTLKELFERVPEALIW